MNWRAAGFITLLAALQFAFSTTPKAALPVKPQRIVSINLCTDQVLLMLVPRERILSVSKLAAQAEYSYMWQQAQGLAINDAQIEQIIPLQPDLILADNYTSHTTVNMLQKLGYPVQTVTVPLTLAEVAEFVHKVGALVGEPEAAQHIIATLHQRLAAIDSAVLPNQRTALIYAPNGHTAGRNSLKNEVLTRAGFRNIAANAGIEDYGSLSIEQVLYARPDYIIIDDSTVNQDSLAQSVTRHPALQLAFGASATVKIPANQWLCAGPMAVDAMATLVNLP